MFTGIVEEVGRVLSIEVDETRARLEVGCATVLEDATLGASIAVDGCCLTVTELGDELFAADLMAETLRATTLGELVVGSEINLERPLRAGGRFGGHIVQGHVDGVGEITDREDLPGTRVLTVRAPDGLDRYLAAKGSVAVSGVSLTVVDVTTRRDTAHFRVGLVPHTREVTTLGSVDVGDRVNLEADVVAKYVERMIRETGPTS